MTEKRIVTFLTLFLGLLMPVVVVAVTSADTSDTGAAIYASRCAGCHGPDGKGSAGLFPPLKGDPVVTDKDPTRHIAIVLFGLEGQTIGGVTYPVSMPAHQSVLTDAEVAAVINHERTSWGNHAPTVTAKEVSRIRNR